MLLAACTDDDEGPNAGPGGTAKYDPSPTSLSIIAGSEQETVLNTVVNSWCTEHRYKCTFTLKGSVDQARLLAAGNADFDAYWFASSVFQQVGDTGSRLQDVKPMFLTPVVFAGWQSEMRKLGFVGKTDVAIGDILTAVESGRTTVWATNPTQSNSGATVLFGFLNYFAGNGPGQALTQQQLESAAVDAGITRFTRAISSTPPSTGTLMKECLDHPDRCKTLFTYEDLVIEKNQELIKAGREPLYTVYPRGSLAISDAPLGFLPHGNASDEGKRKALNELQNYLLTSPDAQAKLLKLGRRPATSIGLTLDNPDTAVFNPAWGIQANLREQGIQFPSSAVITAALNRYQTRYRKPVAAYYCLDGSGSMGGNNGWTGVRDAAHQIFDQDQAALNLLLTHPEDRTTVTVFNSAVTAGSPWQVTGDGAGDLHGLVEKINGYKVTGGTNMYACLLRAAEELGKEDSAKRKRLVIVMSDGQSESRDHDAAVAALGALGVPVIAIAFGSDADPRQLQEVATATGGAFVQQNDLVAALRQAAGYK
ncbi:Ca-activated chloride channel family protein [Allocatelliglobosispora scoriae]|uniref:Ca-activated chloride channel family protein n=1 Tax=Allocatelliglobosispora scoriae TaxID=643052 RepID=A0A841BJW5_9ACTN|nr:vWA domain-containing protein [Allocatelliglobosispora scoriae]MBB5867935.1 Ca-activated chloride channel family protein [Allocatelliglobosispora scoriae]